MTLVVEQRSNRRRVETGVALARAEKETSVRQAFLARGGHRHAPTSRYKPSTMRHAQSGETAGIFRFMPVRGGPSVAPALPCTFGTTSKSPRYKVLALRLDSQRWARSPYLGINKCHRSFEQLQSHESWPFLTYMHSVLYRRSFATFSNLRPNSLNRRAQGSRDLKDSHSQNLVFLFDLFLCWATAEEGKK